MTTSDKSYSSLLTLPTFEERFRYLKLGGAIGEETFGFDRYLNQAFYSTIEWKNFRRDMIVRDIGCDLGISDRPIGGIIVLHHINPIAIADIRQRNLEVLLNPENVICVSHNTHMAIHYGDESILTPTSLTERRPNDTCPWRR